MTRVLIWVQHLLGTGHTVRAVAIAGALRARGASVTLLLGATPPPTLDLADLDAVALTPVRATDASFNAIVGPDGEPYAALAAGRRAAIEAAIERVRPDVFLTETFPLGRRPFVQELLGPLERLAARQTLIAASVRDVLVAKPAPKEQAMAELVRRFYGRVLVHADPAFVTLADSFGAAASIEPQVSYTGFVHAPPTPGPAELPRGFAPDVLVSCGGGAVGAALIEATIGAAGPDVVTHILVPQGLADALPLWRAAAPRNVTLEPNRPDFPALLQRARVSVSQAGYNTVLDVLRAGVRCVLVPFAQAGETEQTARAKALEARRLARVLPEAELTAAGLRETVLASLAGPPPPRVPLALDGAERSAEILLAGGAGRTGVDGRGVPHPPSETAR